MIESLECRRLFVAYNDLLVLAQNYGDSKMWQSGDFNSSNAVNFDDLLALANNYGSGTLVDNMGVGSFHDDWALATQLRSGKTGDWAEVREKKLIIHMDPNAPGETVLTARKSSNGQLRIFSFTSWGGEDVQILKVKASKVTSVQIIGSASPDAVRLAAGFPAASIYLGDGDDYVRATENASTIYAGSGNDTIYAGGGDDVVYGGEGTDSLFGEGGDDKLCGDAHKDFLNGGKGKNELIGGEGTDYFTARSKDKIRREDRDRVKVID